MQLEACIFNANSHQGLSLISFLQLARHWLLFFENHSRGGSRFLIGRAECAGALGGDMRGVWDLQSWDLQFRTCAFDSTRHPLSTTRAADSIAPCIPPGLGIVTGKRETVKIYENLWKTMKIWENPWTYKKIYANLWKIIKFWNFGFWTLGLAFKIFFGLWRFFWDLWCLTSPVVCKNYISEQYFMPNSFCC